MHEYDDFQSAGRGQIPCVAEKTDALLKFPEFVAEHAAPNSLQTDNGDEFPSNALRKLRRESQVKQDSTVPNSPYSRTKWSS